ncbi:hypothetical protein AVEN_263761-1 [Araneus ventricosus]|uniref:Uncharacterized protein n=1 Tax=Araneus ventricosus TaxID=182803 RepID=A0A4Y2ARW3_ARAVE|nr:hypothetical protein AVEN_263761-1 [Araneus ventricosus]
MSKDSVQKGRGGLVVRSRLRGRRAPGSKPNSTGDPPCVGPAKSYVVAKRPPADVVWKLAERCHPRHLTYVQNYKACPKIALLLLLNGMLI